MFPYDAMGKSAAGIVCDESGGRFGPFAGQVFVADQSHSMVMRCFLEEVDGVLQGACFRFREGFRSGSLALQFSRPLWMIPLALCFLSEVVGFRRVAVATVGFLGVVMYARPFTEGFDPNAIVGAFGGLFAALVVVAIKNLQKTESTRVIMFYYAFLKAFFAAVPAPFP